jgi:hypothetical protein
LLGFGRTRGAPGQHDTLADAFNVNIRIGHRLLECGAHAVEIACHSNIEAGNLLAVGIKEENVGLTDSNADHVDTS